MTFLLPKILLLRHPFLAQEEEPMIEEEIREGAFLWGFINLSAHHDKLFFPNVGMHDRPYLPKCFYTLLLIPALLLKLRCSAPQKIYGHGTRGCYGLRY